MSTGILASAEIIGRIGQMLQDIAEHVPNHEFRFFIHLALALTFTLWGCSISFKNGSRSQAQQTIIAILSLVLSFMVPLDQVFVTQVMLRGALLLLSLISIVIIPVALPKVLVSDGEKQAVSSMNIYYFVIVLFFINLVWR